MEGFTDTMDQRDRLYEDFSVKENKIFIISRLIGNNEIK